MSISSLPAGNGQPEGIIVFHWFDRCTISSLPVDNGQSKGSYLAALILIGGTVQIPILAALITVAIYVSPTRSLNILGQLLPSLEVGWGIVLTGLIITLLIWLVVALLCRNFTTFEGADVRSSSTLRRRCEILKARNDILQERFKNKKKHAASQSVPVQGCEEVEHEEEMALKEIKPGLNDLTRLMECDRPIWVLSTGYISMWNRLHDVEQAMMDILPIETLLQEATHDQLRLDGSDILDKDKRDKLRAASCEAIKTLSLPAPASLPAEQMSKQQAKATLREIRRALNKFIDEAIKTLSPPAPATPPTEQMSKQQAKATLREIRCTLNKFTDESWAGLVRTRNLLTLTALLGGGFTYILLIIAVLSTVKPQAILAATGFYLVGVVFGLFNQLVIESKDDGQTVGDYGIRKARILTIPVLSGLAAVSGVLIAALLGITAPNQGATPSVLNNLQAIYDLNGNFRGLIFAAAFGLLPNYLVGILKKQGDNLQSQINSVSSADLSNSNSSASKDGKGKANQ